MQNIPIQALPTQTFTIQLDNNEWNIAIRTTNGTISCTFILNGVTVIENTRAVAGRAIIPYKYEESGNFAIITQDFEIPDYTKFGITQQMVYISQSELDATRTPDTGIITVSDFDPNGALPLRFRPQGYVLG